MRGFFAQTAAIPIAMSRFGQERLAGVDALYVPHGVDTTVFAPRAQAEARASASACPRAPSSSAPWR